MSKSPTRASSSSTRSAVSSSLASRRASAAAMKAWTRGALTMRGPDECAVFAERPARTAACVALRSTRYSSAKRRSRGVSPSACLSAFTHSP